MDKLNQFFEDRIQEINSYLDLLRAVEVQVQSGIPRFGTNGNTVVVTPQQQKILYSSVYLQLYNLVEATITQCVDAVTAAASNSHWKPGDLSVELRREWVRFIARTHIELNVDNRLDCTFNLCNDLIESQPVSQFQIEKGGGGNWDDSEIDKISKRIGVKLNIDPLIKSSVKRSFRDDKGTLAFIKALRNKLAHGNISFAECGEEETVQQLQDLADRTTKYLKEIVKSFEMWIEEYEFLIPDKRPARGVENIVGNITIAKYQQ